MPSTKALMYLTGFTTEIHDALHLLNSSVPCIESYVYLFQHIWVNFANLNGLLAGQL